MNRPLVACGALALAFAAFGQDSTQLPRFEVASVKPTEPNVYVVGMFTYTGGRVTASNYTLKMLIHDAYAVEMYQILGGPAWSETDRFSLEAKPAASSPLSKWTPVNFKAPPNDEMKKMLQALLEERFQLKLHRESKKEYVYALTVAKSGSKLVDARDSTQQPFVGFRPHAVNGQNATSDLLVERLATIVRRPIINRTNLKGNYDFLIDYASDEAGTDTIGLLLRALPEQVGLKLETEPGSVDVIVIDRAERPSPN
jgi:uncharacterized protein (TIGR03435 family)